jgi:hypothetical protein
MTWKYKSNVISEKYIYNLKINLNFRKEKRWINTNYLARLNNTMLIAFLVLGTRFSEDRGFQHCF